MLFKMLKSLWFSRAKAADANTTLLLDEIERLAADDLAGAVSLCQAAVKSYQQHPRLLTRLGSLLARAGRVEEARPILERMLRLDQDDYEALFNLGAIALVEGRFQEAAQHLDHALMLHPDDAGLLTNRGQAALGIGASEQAAAFFRRALAVDPSSEKAAEQLFQLLMQQEAYEEALALVERLVALAPTNGRFRRMKGYLLFKRFYEPEEAERCYAYAEASQSHDAQYWTERGICARDRGELAQAIDYFERALNLSPQAPLARFHRGLARLYREDYANGWADYESRFADSTLREIKLPGPRWQGEPLDGQCLTVVAEQGIGDEIMFASCLNELPPDSRIGVTCSGKLLPIFRASFPACEVFDKDEVLPARLSSCRAIPIGSLPGLFRPTRESFPRIPYLHASDAGREKAQAFLGGLPSGQRIGISWRGGTEMSRRRLRTLPIEKLAELLGLPGINWISLQYGDCTDDLASLRQVPGVELRHPQELLDDYDATAALVEGLDLVITVCTAIVHLAGALGKEVWVLAPKVPEWRYGLDFRFMPWYRQVEVLRQLSSGDWAALLGMVRQRLAGAGQ